MVPTLVFASTNIIFDFWEVGTNIIFGKYQHYFWEVPINIFLESTVTMLFLGSSNVIFGEYQHYFREVLTLFLRSTNIIFGKYRY